MAAVTAKPSRVLIVRRPRAALASVMSSRMAGGVFPRRVLAWHQIGSIPAACVRGLTPAG